MIEEKVFSQMRFDPAKMSSYGFVRQGNGYSFSNLFMDGDFRAEVTVSKDGTVTGRVIDVMNEEEYTPLRNPLYNGAYANTVRDAYEKLLTDIAEACCSRIPDGRERVINDELIREVLSIADSIPYGHVATYGQIAAMIGREKNARMVGKIMSMADRYGDHPCHRVVNHAGRTVPGWTEQRSLLEAEGISFRNNGCVDIEKFRWKPESLDL